MDANYCRINRTLTLFPDGTLALTAAGLGSNEWSSFSPSFLFIWPLAISGNSLNSRSKARLYLSCDKRDVFRSQPMWTWEREMLNSVKLKNSWYSQLFVLRLFSFVYQPSFRCSKSTVRFSISWRIFLFDRELCFYASNLYDYTRVLLAYIALPWPGETPPPKIELYACVVLAGAGIILLPVLLGAAIFKFGNLANDGIKLGRHLSACSRDPPSSFLTSNPDTSKWNIILV